MTPSPFQIKSTLGRSYRVDLDDSRRTKEALLQLGYFKTPRYGLTQYPDEPLFAAIEQFQQDNGLQRDGIMRPEGETAIHLGRALVDRDSRSDPPEGKGFAEGEWDWRDKRHGRASKILLQPNIFDLIRVMAEGLNNDPKDIEATKRALGWAGYYPSDGSSPDVFAAIRRFQSDRGLEVDGFMRPRGPTARALDEAITSKVLAWREENPEAAKPEIEIPDESVESTTHADEQIAQVQARDLGIPNFGGPAGAVLGRGLALQLMKEGMRVPRDEDTLDADVPVPRWMKEPESGAGPPNDVPEKEKILSVEQEVLTFRGQPISELIKTDPLAFEIVKDELHNIVQSDRGDEFTQEGNTRTAELCVDEFEKGWGSESGRTFTHKAGAKKKNKDGDYQPLKEKYLKNKHTGRLGSSNADVTWKFQQLPGDPTPDIDDYDQNVPHEMQGNSGIRRQDEKPIASEARQLQRLIQNAADQKDLADFFTKLRPGMDKDKWEEKVRKECRSMLTRIFGPPPERSENK